MMMRLSTIFLIVFLMPLPAFSQADSIIKRIQVDGYVDFPDSVKKALEIITKYSVPGHETRNSSFRYFEQADSFSRIHDTINAEKNFLLIDTYYLLSMQVAYSNDEFMKRFALTDSVRLYTKKILSGLTRTAYFDSFAFSYLQVQEYKTLMNHNVDASYEDSLHKIDSIQQGYLWDYIKKHGAWPALNDGAVFAAVIASRDIEHFYRYVPFAVGAYYDNKISNRQMMQILDNKFSYSFYMEVRKNTGDKYLRHDISWCLNGRTSYMNSADLISKIGNDIKNKCPVKNIFFVHYVNNIRTFAKNDYCDEAIVQEDGHDLLILVKNNCPRFSNIPNGVACNVYHLPNLSYHTEKLFFYISY